MRPVIGLPVCQQDGKQQFVTQTYLNAVTDSGGLPLLLPLLPDQISSDTYLKLCDGFLFCGGGDITPLLFGQEPLTSRGTTDLAMDRFHLDLMTQALESQKPILAICRGMQVMNVALGGSLFQDLSLRPLSSLSHMQPSLLRRGPEYRDRNGQVAQQQRHPCKIPHRRQLSLKLYVIVPPCTKLRLSVKRAFFAAAIAAAIRAASDEVDPLGS